MSAAIHPEPTAMLAAEHRQQLLAAAAEHRLRALATRRRRQLRLRRHWAVPARPAPITGGEAA